MNQHYLAPGRKYEVISSAFKRRKKATEIKDFIWEQRTPARTRNSSVASCFFPQAHRPQRCVGEWVELQCFNKVLWNFVNMKGCKCLQFWSRGHLHSAVLDFNGVLKNIKYVIHVAVLFSFSKHEHYVHV